MKEIFKFTGFFFFLSLFTISIYAKDTINIGVQAPITGKYASEGQSINNGVKLIAEQYNKNGGILGKKINIITCDDEGTAQKAAICARKLANEKVFAVIGSYTSGATEAAQATYFRSGILQTSDGTGDSLTKKKYWTFFRNSFQNSEQGIFTAKYLVQEKQYKKIVILSDYSSYSTSLADALKNALLDLNTEVLFYDKIKSGAQNFTAILTKIKSLNPDVIYFSGYYTDGGLLRAQQVQLGIKADFIGGDSNDNPDFLNLAGTSAKNAMLINFPTPDRLPYDLAKDFLKDYQAKYNSMPASIWTLMNVDGMRAILHACSELKTFDTKKISDFLHTLKDFPGITGAISFREDGERINTQFMVYEIDENNAYKMIFPKM